MSISVSSRDLWRLDRWNVAGALPRATVEALSGVSLQVCAEKLIGFRNVHKEYKGALPAAPLAC